MSKCREEFEKHFGDDAFLPSLESWHCWKDAWNARGKVDYQKADANYADEFVLKAIEQENEK